MLLPLRTESYDAENQLVAKTIRFKGNDFDQAQAIEAGVHETATQAAVNQSELEKQNALLQEQNAALKQQQAQLTEQEKKLAEQKALIAANTARFGQLDDYYIYDGCGAFTPVACEWDAVLMIDDFRQRLRVGVPQGVQQRLLLIILMGLLQSISQPVPLFRFHSGL